MRVAQAKGLARLSLGNICYGDSADVLKFRFVLLVSKNLSGNTKKRGVNFKISRPLLENINSPKKALVKLYYTIVKLGNKIIGGYHDCIF
jgi:hypothetical protein